MAITLRHNPWTISLQVAKHVFRNALAWCSQHKNDPAPSQSDDADSRSKTTEIEGWDHKFMQFDRNMLFQTILAAVSKHILKKALEWCSQHKNGPVPTQFDDVDSRKKTTDTEEWDQKFMQVDHHEVILAANYMDIKALLDVYCKTVANTIKSKPPEEIRNTSTQGWKVSQAPHNADADSLNTTSDIEEWNEQYFLVKLHEPPFPLLDISCKTVANMIKGEPPEEIRKTFNIQNDFILEIRETFNVQNDFTPDAEDKIRRGNEWADGRLEERNLLIKKKQPG